MAFRLQTLLDLKLRAEEDAERCLAEAMAFHAKVQARQQALENEVTKARQRLTEARQAAAEPAATAGDQLGRERFRQRLAEAVRLKMEEAKAHRLGPLAEAQRQEQAARDKHLEARREREALEKHKEKEEAKARVVAERRAEDAASDLAIAAHFRKPR
jgi:flagellar biosynthesis chaperone FliJ